MVVLVLLRLAGKRELGQMTPFDLVVILVIANAVQNAMTGGDNSLTGGIIAAATLTLVNIAVGRWGSRVPFFRRLVVSQPTLFLRDGKPIEDAGGAQLEPAAEQQVEDRAADERADDPENDRAEPAHRVGPGHDPPRDRAGDETDDDPAGDPHVKLLRLNLVALGHRFLPSSRRDRIRR